MSDKLNRERTKYLAVIAEADRKATRGKPDSSIRHYWINRAKYYRAELAKMGGDSDTGIEQPRGER